MEELDNDFSALFTEEHFREIFQGMKYKKGGGRDRLTAFQYSQLHDDDFVEVPTKCLLGTFRFTPYNERLKLKGRSKLPRVISVPTIRDRIVLKVLNEYLQLKFPDAIRRKTANENIRDIDEYITEHEADVLTFTKYDLVDFYGSIQHKQLIDCLEGKVCTKAKMLIERAMTTPTLELHERDVEDNHVGVPQGLSISNLLSDIYMTKFDDMGKGESDIYVRYVDDILTINSKKSDLKELYENFLHKEYPGLSFNEEKYSYGIIGKDDFEYLGYLFSGKRISVRKPNITRIFDKLAKECNNFKKGLEHKALWERKFDSREDFINAKVALLNMTIGGIRSNKKLYGWSFFYQKINDSALLDHMDRFVRNQLGFLGQEQYRKVLSFRKIHYAIMSGDHNKYLFDFDEIDSVDKMREFLIYFGFISKHQEIDDEEIRRLYDINRRNIRKNLEAHIGGMY